MKNVAINIFLLFLLSCNSNNKINDFDHEIFKEITFKNDNFKEVFERSLSDLEIGGEEFDKSIIIKFYTDPYQNYDTIVSIQNCPPTCVKNLVLVKMYDTKKVYLYCNENLLNRFSRLIDISNDSLNSVNLKPVKNEFECIYKKNFKLKNDDFIAND